MKNGMGVIGASAIFPPHPEMLPHKFHKILKNHNHLTRYSDVGFRLAFPVPPMTLSFNLPRTLENKFLNETSEFIEEEKDW